MKHLNRQCLRLVWLIFVASQGLNPAQADGARYIVEQALRSGQPLSQHQQTQLFKNDHFTWVYIRDVLKAPWPAAEATLLKSNRGSDYAATILKRRWPEYEAYWFKEDPQFVVVMSRYFGMLKIRDARVEAALLSGTNYPMAVTYFKNVGPDKWPEARWPALEKIVSDKPQHALAYAKANGRRLAAAEPLILNSADPHAGRRQRRPQLAIDYAAAVIKGRWPALEQHLIQQPLMATYYAGTVIEGRFPEVEPVILKSLDAVTISYASRIMKGRWPEAEVAISERLRQTAESPDSSKSSKPYKPPTPRGRRSPAEIAALYAINVSARRHQEWEAAIAADGEAALLYALGVLQTRWPEAEPAIARHPDKFGPYIERYIRGRWPEAEQHLKDAPMHQIMKYLEAAQVRWPEYEDRIAAAFQQRAIPRYARCCIKGRWPQGEALMLAQKFPYFHVMTDYALTVIGGRWPEAEALYLQAPYYAAAPYIREVIKGRWPEYEAELLKIYDQPSEQSNEQPIQQPTQQAGKIPWAQLWQKPKLKKLEPRVYHYIDEFIQGRWPELEAKLVNHPKAAAAYKKRYLQGDEILNNQ